MNRIAKSRRAKSSPVNPGNTVNPDLNSFSSVLTPDEGDRLQALAEQEGMEVAEWTRRLVREHLPLTALEHAEVEPPAADALTRAIQARISRTPEQRAESRARALATYPPRRPLPPGKTLGEVVSGRWPGDETDEQVDAALEELS